MSSKKFIFFLKEAPGGLPEDPRETVKRKLELLLRIYKSQFPNLEIYVLSLLSEINEKLYPSQSGARVLQNGLMIYINDSEIHEIYTNILNVARFLEETDPNILDAFGVRFSEYVFNAHLSERKSESPLAENLENYFSQKIGKTIRDFD